MRIVVCIRQGLDGQINPFDASAYEAALRIPDSEVILLSMGPISTQSFLLQLTRLGAKKAVLLSDKVFAGSDTLATAYTLSLAVKKLQPDLVFCGKQTLIGDTGQTGPMLSVIADYMLVTNVMAIQKVEDNHLQCTTRSGELKTLHFPGILTIERNFVLRLPKLGSKMCEVEIWSASDLDADISRCGLLGSPTRVIESRQNESGRRNCQFISLSQLPEVINQGLNKQNALLCPNKYAHRLPSVICIGSEPQEYANMVCKNIKFLEKTTPEDIAAKIRELDPDAVLWASDPWSKETAAKVAALLQLGLCADCTSLETDGSNLFMIRPALAGSVIAKIKSLTRPAMATVRTVQTDTPDIVVTAGYGTRNALSAVKGFVEILHAQLATTRKMVDNDYLPYEFQVGLTGKRMSPPLYIAIGVSGAVHHIAGMEQSGTVIAINPDKDAPIFEYADYGILEEFSDQTYEAIKKCFDTQ